MIRAAWPDTRGARGGRRSGSSMRRSKPKPLPSRAGPLWRCWGRRERSTTVREYKGHWTPPCGYLPGWRGAQSGACWVLSGPCTRLTGGMRNWPKPRRRHADARHSSACGTARMPWRRPLTHTAPASPNGRSWSRWCVSVCARSGNRPRRVWRQDCVGVCGPVVPSSVSRVACGCTTRGIVTSVRGCWSSNDSIGMVAPFAMASAEGRGPMSSLG